VNESKLAEKLAEKAASVGKGGISSDDPDAVAKLKIQLEKITKAQNTMVAFNKAMRAGDAAGMLAAVGTEEKVRLLMMPDYMGRTGFQAYSLSNNRANMKRVEERIAALEKKAAAVTYKEIVRDGYKIVQNPELNRIQFVFEGKPSGDIISKLKQCGFRWAPSCMAWQRHLNNAGVHAANDVRRYLGEVSNG
jgi:hypothetical protein